MTEIQRRILSFIYLGSEGKGKRKGLQQDERGHGALFSQITNYRYVERIDGLDCEVITIVIQ